MRGFAVIPEFRVKPGCLDAFLALAAEDARASLAGEPGCRRFDILVLEGASDHVLFYEIYDDRAAFDAHLATPHLARFKAGLPALAEEVIVRSATLQPG